MALIVDDADITMSKAAKMLKFSKLTLAGPESPEYCFEFRRRIIIAASSSLTVLFISVLLTFGDLSSSFHLALKLVNLVVLALIYRETLHLIVLE